jgi:HlyD family secretion protein/macrolide-specific efflux system membrane fusion protein
VSEAAAETPSVDLSAPIRSPRSRRRRRRRWPWVMALVLVAGGVWLVGARGAGKAKELDKALLVDVKRADLRIEVIETGKVQPRERVEIKSKVAGQVARVFVEEGQKVKRGQLLLRLDATDYQRDVERCQADVDQARLAVEYAELMLDRRKKGLAERGVPQADVDFAANDLAAKRVAYERAKVALVAARDKLRYTEIQSPLDGTVIEKGIRVGEVVTPGVQATFEGKPLLTVADLSTIIVKADLNQIDVARVKLGQKVTLTLDALPGKSYEAEITKVAPASMLPKGKDVDVFPVEATLKAPDGDIKPGMTADVRVHIETKPKVLVLPIEAVVKEKGKSWVTVVTYDEKGRPKTDRAEVTTGARNDREVEIVSGVKEGQKILIKPGSASENEYKS